MTPIIETDGLTKRFGERLAVAELDLAVPRGSAFGFLGHNGAGKTTLIRMLLGLTRPDAGAIRIAGLPLPAQRARVLARVGAVVEGVGGISFHAHLTGRENLRILAAVRGPETYPRIPGALARVGLSDRADDRVKTYSQGMRQRLGVARCLLADPELLILDEPLNGLDPAGIQEFRETIASLRSEGRTIFLSSHQLDEVEKTCDAAAVIDQGRLIAQGPIAELMSGGQPELEIGCDDPAAARQLLHADPAVAAVHDTPGGGLRVHLLTGGRAEGAGAVNARLVQAGIAVFRLEPAQESLEQRFLRTTTRVGGSAT
ncbi:MAG TPA: ABC transporter ATP-binding protein [Solirubrobacteraceae bacterium]|jgi:ABC-2 type transport system ATP-binding protein|nr:ABC transporter ATP-binding protein [Solirubrobacteraceae bacterium]